MKGQKFSTSRSNLAFSPTIPYLNDFGQLILLLKKKLFYSNLGIFLAKRVPGGFIAPAVKPSED
jgi:hypothetical protein